jgi:hypothetical protein
MVMGDTRANAGVARFVVVGTLFAASVAGMLVRPMKLPPPKLAGSTHSPAISTKAAALPVLSKLYGQLPLRFEANLGQTDPRVKFISRGANSVLFLTSNEAVLTLDKPPAKQPDSTTSVSTLNPIHHPRDEHRDRVALRMSLEGANPRADVRGEDSVPGKSNYFIGNNPQNWRTNVPAYSRVKYHGIYPGVDLVYYGSQRALEYDFVVAPEANVNQIRLKIDGADRVAITPKGDLVMATRAGEVRLNRPVIYQRHGGAQTPVDGGYFLSSAYEIGLRLGPYDRSRELVIDPVLQYSTFLGGTTSDAALAITVNANGYAYITGKTSSTDFPVSSGSLQTSLHGSTNAFITELNPSGTALVYSTYLGGSAADQGNAIAIDSQGDAYVTGLTTSSNFPAVNAFEATLKSSAGDAFVSELSPTGASLIFSTYLGGSGPTGDVGNGIAVDASGDAYVAGTTSSTDFPVQTPLDGTLMNSVGSAFVTEFSTGGATLVYSTYLSGSGASGDTGNAISVDTSGEAYVTGATSSTNFATTSGAYQSALKGTGFNAFLTKIGAGGTSYVYSTFLGGSTANGGLGYGVALDPNNNAYLTGLTSASDFPITPGAAQGTLTGTGGHAFVSEINPSASGTASLLYSTYLGGSNSAAQADIGRAIAVDATGNANVTGTATSTDFPVTPGALQSTLKSAGGNAFVTRVNPTATIFLYSTFLGGSNPIGDQGMGISLDSTGAAYVAGQTSSSDFPTTTGVLRPNFSAASGQTNGFVAKVAANVAVSVAPSSIDFGNVLLNKSGPAELVTVTNNTSAPLTLSPAPVLGGPNASEFVISSACGNSSGTVTLQPNTDCTVTVNFTPVTLGAASASLTFTDGDPSSPQVIPLTGTGYVDFSITATTPAAVSDGNTSTFTVTVTPIDNSTQDVGLACTGAPAGTTCVLSPSALTLDGTDAASSIGTITVDLSLPTGSAHAPPFGKFGGRGLLIFLAFATIAGFAMTRRRALRLGLASAAFACLLIVGCSPAPGTPSGAYNLQITGTATPGGQSHSVVIVLTID